MYGRKRKQNFEEQFFLEGVRKWETHKAKWTYIPPIVHTNVATKARTPYRLLLTTFPGNERHEFHRKCSYGRVLPAPKPGAPDRM